MKPASKKAFNSKIGNLGDPFRWGVLGAVALIFTIILYPNLVVTHHDYHVGDVAEKDVKAPKDFFIVDTAATEASRKMALDAVLTVYDHDRNLAPALVQRIRDAFAELRGGVEPAGGDRPAGEENPALKADGPAPALTRHEQIWLKKADFEEALGIEVSEGAYTILEKEGFSREISDLIARILSAIMENGVVANKEILL